MRAHRGRNTPHTTAAPHHELLDGILALQRASGNAAVAALTPREREIAVLRAVRGGTPPRPRSPRQARPDPATTPVAQRKVGFEFETGWLVRKKRLIGSSSMAKKDPIGPAHTGFKLEADEAGGGKSEIEFIVHPPVEESAEGEQDLDRTMTALANLGTALQTTASTRPTFLLSQATGRADDHAYLVEPTSDRALRAGPQVTSGLDLAKIPRLRQDAVPIPDALTNTAALMQFRANSVQVPGVGAPSAKLVGLLTLITQYLTAGGTPHKAELSALDANSRYNIALNYPKQIGDELLARTDFAHLFTLLPDDEQAHWRAHDDEWVNLALTNTPPALLLTADDSVISRGVKVDENRERKGTYTPKLTIREWLTGLLGGVDRLRTLKDAESMGEFGAKKERIGAGPTAADVGIFEFRGAQNNKIPVEQWRDFALGFHRYIAALHRLP
ncbi:MULTISPECIES: hypothetical protein [Actinosynnema]|uniref:hypothetical protein n=1 Tax=Actinosynnema TaxID=40566 RepID=UPI0020A3D723|nr:hypothetical protein [Actinosynnema pretiosum]